MKRITQNETHTEWLMQLIIFPTALRANANDARENKSVENQRIYRVAGEKPRRDFRMTARAHAAALLSCNIGARAAAHRHAAAAHFFPLDI